MRTKLLLCIIVILVFVTSCTTDRRLKDLELGKKLSVLGLNESINLSASGEYNYLFKRFDYANGIVDLGGINYVCLLSKKDGKIIYNLAGKDTTYYYQVKIYEQQAAPAGIIQRMEIKKVYGRYRCEATVGNFGVVLEEVKGSVATIWVVNNSKKPFAYAEMLPTQGADPILPQIKFSSSTYQKMDVFLGNRLVIYEYVETKDGITLKENCRIPYVARLFGL